MAEKEKLEVQVTTQGAERAAKNLDKVAKSAKELDGKKIDVDLGSDTDLISEKLSALAGPGGIVAGIGAGFALVANNAADAAIEADNLASLTGDSVETASRLNAVWKQTGADSKDLQDVLLQMNGVLSTNAGLAEELGVNLSDGATVGERFEEVSKALDGITDAAKRSQIASQVFGEEGVRQYNALRQAVGDVGTAMEDVASGQVFDEGDVEDARKMKRELAELRGELTGFANDVGKFAIPAINDLIGGFKEWFSQTEEAGHSLRNFLTTGNITTEADKSVEAWSASAQAARDFDRALLDGLDTFAAVHAAVVAQTGDVTAAGIVALEWKDANEEAADAVRDVGERAANAGPKIGDMAKALANAADEVVDFGDKAANAGPKIGDMASALDEAQEKLAALGDELAGELGQLDLLDDIKDQFDDIAEAQEKLTDGGEAETRDYNREVRRLQGQLIEFLSTLEDIPAEKRLEILAQIRTGDLETLRTTLDDLTQDRWINVGVRPNPQQAFSSIGGTFSPTQAAPVINGSNSAPASTGGYVDNRQITIINPVGSTPTTQYIDSQTDFRRNGNR